MSKSGSVSHPIPDGLRERTKLRTRQRISTQAAALFNQRGFAEVRMSEIAAAAEVSEQTLYNYFPSKEHLVFDLDSEYEARIVAVVARAQSGVPLARSLRDAATLFLDETSRSDGARKRTLPTAFLATGPSVRRVWLELNARVADSVAEALMQWQGDALHPATAAILARWIVSVFSVILEHLGSIPPKARNRQASIRKLRDAVDGMITLAPLDSL